ncbi:VacJ family lipoprotein [Crenothrix sp.]|uniref:MlaA family lipoprotein n=1 Tax=Crenothrix sp. TaxID=3100433 RepID=UPI00374CE94C
MFVFLRKHIELEKPFGLLTTNTRQGNRLMNRFKVTNNQAFEIIPSPFLAMRSDKVIDGQTQKIKHIGQAAGLVFCVFLSGCATTSHHSNDPLEGWNRGVQSFNDEFDDYVMKPVAKGYNWVMPEFANQGVSNFFSNLNDIGVTINDLLQFKLAQTGQDGSRFLLNTTAGLGGLFDVASMVDLPKHQEDFDQTLGVWGLPASPYIVLPLLGPSSPRGITGLIGDAALNPVTYVGFGAFPGLDSAAETGISLGLYGLNAVDKRADNIGAEKALSEAASIDRYEFIKNAYFQRRKYLVNDGNLPEGEDDPLGNPKDGKLAPLDPY